MVHSKSLRAIGQSLETAKIPSFELVADGQNYVVKSELLTGTGEWVLRHALSRNDFSEQTARQSTVKRSVRFTPGNISRLEDPTGTLRGQTFTSILSLSTPFIVNLGTPIDTTPETPNHPSLVIFRETRSFDFAWLRSTQARRSRSTIARDNAA